MAVVASSRADRMRVRRSLTAGHQGARPPARNSGRRRSDRKPRRSNSGSMVTAGTARAPAAGFLLFFTKNKRGSMFVAGTGKIKRNLNTELFCFFFCFFFSRPQKTPAGGGNLPTLFVAVRGAAVGVGPRFGAYPMQERGSRAGGRKGPITNGGTGGRRSAPPSS